MKKLHLLFQLFLVLIVSPLLSFGQGSISGHVLYNNISSTPIQNANVTLYNQNGSIAGQTVTDTTGFYSFTNVAFGNYTVKANCNLTEGGISLEDAYLVLKYLQGSAVLTPLQLKAADVDFNGHINIFDVLGIVKRYVLQTQHFTPAWVFETVAVQITGNKDASGDGGGEIRGSTTGDVNGSYSPPQTKEEVPQIIMNSQNVLSFYSNTVVTLPLKFSDNVEVQGLGLIINYPAKYLKVNSIKTIDPSMITNVLNGQIRIGWRDTSARTLKLTAEQIFARIDFSPTYAFTKGMVLEFSLDKESEVVTDLKNSFIPELQMPKLQMMGNGLCEINSIYPNPMATNGTIKFFLSEEGNTTIKITDLTGKLVSVIANENMPAGDHEINFSTESLAKGTYNISVIFNNSENKAVKNQRITVIK